MYGYFFFFFFIVPSVYSHKSSDEKPVHQQIVRQAHYIWPYNSDNQEAKDEFSIFLDNGNVPVNYTTGDDIVEGAQEEDFYDVLRNQPSDNWFLAAINSDNFFHHFWDPDQGDSKGYFIDKSAYEIAYLYLYGGSGELYKFDVISSSIVWYLVPYTFEGAISLYKRDEKGLAYYYLGRAAHLLADMSVPAHVHLDLHPPIINPDHYEDFVGDHPYDWNAYGDEQIADFNNLHDIFYDLAQITQYVASDNESGNDLPDHYDIWDNNFEEYWKFEENIRESTENSDTTCREIADQLMPLAFQYTAALFKLFWEDTHIELSLAHNNTPIIDYDDIFGNEYEIDVDTTLIAERSLTNSCFIFYVDGEERYIDNVEPYKFLWHIGYEADGVHTLKVQLQLNDVLLSEKEIHLIVGNSNITISIPGLPDGAKSLEMALIPSGSFIMGSPVDERGRESEFEWSDHQVMISNDFYLGKYEITQAQWEAVMGNNPAENFGIGYNYPAYYLNWYDCAIFCNRLSEIDGRTPVYNEYTWETDWNANGYRLPTEAEWEYACRAGTKTRFSHGDVLNCVDEDDTTICETHDQYMWWYGTKFNPYGSKVVGLKLPNSWGLYDMHGNVWEWCNDWWEDPYSRGSQIDPIGPLNGIQRVAKSGTWASNAKRCRSAFRSKNHTYDPSDPGNSGGFRIFLPRDCNITYGTTIITHGYKLNFTGSTEWKAYKWQFSMAGAIPSANKRVFFLRKGIIYTLKYGYNCNDILSDPEIGDESDIDKDVIKKYFDIALKENFDPLRENVIIFDWIEESDWDKYGYSEAAGDSLFALLIRGALDSLWSLEHLHFIGHSRGCIVNSETIERLDRVSDVDNEAFLPLNLHNKIDREIHVTMLDPHPWFLPNTLDLTDKDPEDHVFFDAQDYLVNSKGAGVECWKNVGYMDVYYQRNATNLLHPIGLDLSDTQKLCNALPGCLFAKDLSHLNSEGTGYYDTDEKKCMDHSYIHTWYHGSIDKLADNDGDSGIIEGYRNEWYPFNNNYYYGYDHSRLKNCYGTPSEIIRTDHTIGVRPGYENIHREYDIDNGEITIEAGYSWLLFGDFSFYNNNTFPGWSQQGGEFYNEEPYQNHVILNKSYSNLSHNVSYIPKNTIGFKFDKKVISVPYPYDRIVISFIDLQSDSERIYDFFYLNSIDDEPKTLNYTFSNDFSDIPGNVWKISFRYKLNDEESPLSGYVSIDNIELLFKDEIIEPPTNLLATATSSLNINLQWQDNSYNEDGFIIERKNDSDETWEVINDVSKDVTTYQDTGLLPETIYTYRVYAYDINKKSVYSNESSSRTFNNIYQDVTISENTTWVEGAYKCDNLHITNNATLTCAGRVDIYCENLNVDLKSKISSDGQGYGPGSGPGAGGDGFGGSYGGRGGIGADGGITYGSITEPSDLGSGGGRNVQYGVYGGRGGGAIKFYISGTLLLNGSITSNGSNGGCTYQDYNYNGSCGGSGGSVYIIASTIEGNGIISTNGGSKYSKVYFARGGGGGRIAVYYDTNKFSGTITSYGGYCGHQSNVGYVYGGAGTIYLKASIEEFGDLLIANSSPYNNIKSAPTDLDNIKNISFKNMIFNSGVDLNASNLDKINTQNFELGSDCSFTNSINKKLVIDVLNDMKINGSMIGYFGFDIGNNLLLSSGGEIISSKPINLNITGNGELKSDSKIEANITCSIGGDLIIENDASISSDGQGYGPGSGPGAGADGFGGSYGGSGGIGTDGGITYGSITEPTDLGSGGGRNVQYGVYGGRGGGAIKFYISGTLRLNGSITSNGSNGGCTYQDYNYNGSCGGSGGSVYIIASTIEGNGIISTNGGSKYSKVYFARGGGGGRIAVYYDTNKFSGTITSYGGYCGPQSYVGYVYGGAGTIYLKASIEEFGDLLIANPYNNIKSAPTDLDNIKNISFKNMIFNSGVDLNASNLDKINTHNFELGSECSFTNSINKILVIDVSNDIKINGSMIGYFGFDIGNNLLLSSGGEIISSKPINLNITGNGELKSDSKIEANITCSVGGDLIIENESTISSNGQGYGPESGPGAGGDGYYNGGGGGYGGHGGSSSEGNNGGMTYGSVTEPSNFGSGGGKNTRYGTHGGRGGGLIKLEINGILSNNGEITSNGANGTYTYKDYSYYGSGGGSGGSVYIIASMINGNGIISANGGSKHSKNFNAGGGGGGRIAIYYNSNDFNGTISSKGGYGYHSYAEDGTIYHEHLSIPNTPSYLISKTISSDRIQLSWQDNSDDEEGFKIERRIMDIGTWQEINQVKSNVTTYRDTCLLSNTTYIYRILAFNKNGLSEYSNESSSTTYEKINYGLFIGSHHGFHLVDYGWISLPNLPNDAHADARCLEAMLDEYMQFSEIDGIDTIMELEYESPIPKNEDVNAQAIINALERIGEYMELYAPTGTFVFYYSGHGATDQPDSTAQALSVGEPFNSGLGNTFGDMIVDEDLGNLLKDSLPETVEKIIILDTCYSGGFWNDALSSVPNCTLLASSGEFEHSYRNIDNGRAIYTLGLIDGLTQTAVGIPRADLKADGLTFQELHDHASMFLLGHTEQYLTNGITELPVSEWFTPTGMGPIGEVNPLLGGDDVFVGNSDSGNSAPVADAGTDQSLDCGDALEIQVTLDGSGSVDPDGDALTYTWSGNGIPTTTTSENKIDFILPVGFYSISLTVSDGVESDTDWVIVIVSQNGIFNINNNYLVNGDGLGEGSGKYWPGEQGYFDAWFIPTLAVGGKLNYPGWCADLDTPIKMGWWYDNTGCYSSLTASSCYLVGNPANFPLVNDLLFLYRTDFFSSGIEINGEVFNVTNNDIQAVIWMLLFNGFDYQFPWDAGSIEGGGITWQPTLVNWIHDYVCTNEIQPDYITYPQLPIVIIIDCGDQVNLLEVPYWLYEELLDLGIVEECL